MAGNWKLVEFKFLPAWEPLMLAGKKTATCRYRMIGQPGDRFNAFNGFFEIVSVEQIQLSEVRDKWYLEEGCKSPDEFVEVWKKIYRRWDPLKLVYLHQFRRLN
jgi:hypothetical protein